MRIVGTLFPVKYRNGLYCLSYSAFDLVNLSGDTYALTTTSEVQTNSEVRLIIDQNLEEKVRSTIKKRRVEIDIYAVINQPIKAIFTIHNIEYQGKFSLDILEDLFGIDKYYTGLLEYGGCINLMKAAIECSERFSTVSPTYAHEIKTEQYAHGLQDIIRKNEFKLTGILNGIDVDSYNPEKDKALFAQFTPDNLENKKVCKTELQKMLGLPVKDVPIIAMSIRGAFPHITKRW